MKGLRLAVGTLLMAGCSSVSPAGSGETSAGATAARTARVTAGEHSQTRGAATAALDSVAVLGHSGATGTLTDPNNLQRDATENSWATGDNPQVQSIYIRLLATHPALKGHNYNSAVNGSGVESLPEQIDQVLRTAEVLPDLVMVQTIDNDMRCDGTDPENYQPFGVMLDQALSKIDATMPGARIFLLSQWSTVDTWTRWAQHVPSQVQNNSGSGPCDVFDPQGRPRPAGISSMQRIVDAYWHQVEQVCARHQTCATDGGAEQREFVPTDVDVAADMNHLSTRGHAKYAAIAWKVLPRAVKEAP
jgi:hypothetical protein